MEQKMSSNKQLQLGMTLIELMVTVAVIAIIMVIALPSYQQYIEKGDLVHVQSKIASIIEVIKTDIVKDPSYLNSLSDESQLNVKVLSMIDNKMKSKYEIKATFICLENTKYTRCPISDAVNRVGFNISAVPKGTNYKYSTWSSSQGANYVCLGTDRNANITAAQSYQTTMPCEKK